MTRLITRLKSAIRKKERTITAYLLIAPDVLGLLVFLVLPIFYALYISFFEWKSIFNYHFVGLKNYISIFSDELWWHSLLIILKYLGLFIPALVVLSLLLALLVNSKMFPLKKLFRTIYFMPYMLSLVVISLVWSLILNPMNGVVNLFLRSLGVEGPQWLGSKSTALLSIAIVNIWWYLGYYMALFLAGLNDIPREYYEAAWMDGAGNLSSFFRITLPLLKPILLFVLVMLTVYSFQVFDQIYIMTRGGPDYATYVTVFYIYEKAFKFLDFGYSSAMSVLLFLIIFTLSLLQIKSLRGGKIE